MPGGRGGHVLARRRALTLFGALFALLLILSAPSDARKLKGTPDDDKIVGTPKRDRIAGRDGDDKLKGLDGHDKLRGGRGNDKLVGGEKSDDLGGGADDDKLKAVDGRPDKRVVGGKGDDLCISDFRDANRIQGCEEVRLKGDGGGGSGGGGGGSGGGGGANAALTITEAAADCPPEASAPPGSLCQFSVEGTGADESFGSVSVEQNGEPRGGAPAQAGEDGSFSSTGPFACQAGEDGAPPTVTLTVEFGDETASTELPCTPTEEGPEPPPDGDDPLTVTASAMCNPGGPGALCSFTAEGTGADAQSGTATVDSTNDNMAGGGGIVLGDPETGSFQVVEGAYGCETGSAPLLTVEIGDEMATAALPCG